VAGLENASFLREALRPRDIGYDTRLQTPPGARPPPVPKLPPVSIMSSPPTIPPPATSVLTPMPGLQKVANGLSVVANGKGAMPSVVPGASLVIVTVSGPDRPGITAKLTGLLHELGAQLLDIEQVVVQGNLCLGLLIGIAKDHGVLKELLFAAKELGCSLDFKAIESVQRPRHQMSDRYVVTVIGPCLGASEVHQLSAKLAEHGGNIARIARLSLGDLRSLEMSVDLPKGASSAELKKTLLRLGMESSFDVALQREGLFRRSKRLVVMDMDSTLIPIEVIDELAKAAGVRDQVAAVTERAMAGEMDYDESLRKRLGLLEGLEVSVLERIAAELPLTEGAETLIRVLRRLGYRTAVISGGFSIAAEALKARLGIDYAYSNTLEVVNGKLTGKVIGPIVNGRRKAELLETIAQAEGVLLDQVIAVGDGANDLLMLEAAGLGIAFRAKPKLREAADTSISTGGLDSILYLLGISAQELAEVLELPG
jgi:phosphoserine phosphatase